MPAWNLDLREWESPDLFPRMDGGRGDKSVHGHGRSSELFFWTVLGWIWLFSVSIVGKRASTRNGVLKLIRRLGSVRLRCSPACKSCTGAGADQCLECASPR
jgi:hypothetical protein